MNVVRDRKSRRGYSADLTIGRALGSKARIRHACTSAEVGAETLVDQRLVIVVIASILFRIWIRSRCLVAQVYKVGFGSAAVLGLWQQSPLLLYLDPPFLHFFMAFEP